MSSHGGNTCNGQLFSAPVIQECPSTARLVTCATFDAGPHTPSTECVEADFDQVGFCGDGTCASLSNADGYILPMPTITTITIKASMHVKDHSLATDVHVPAVPFDTHHVSVKCADVASKLQSALARSNMGTLSAHQILQDAWLMSMVEHRSESRRAPLHKIAGQGLHEVTGAVGHELVCNELHSTRCRLPPAIDKQLWIVQVCGEVA